MPGPASSQRTRETAMAVGNNGLDRNRRPDDIGYLPRRTEGQDRGTRSSNEAPIRAYFEGRLERMEVAATTRTPSGQVIDWVPIESQLPSGQSLADPPSDPVPVTSPDGDRVDHPVRFELEQDGVERGPEGTVPVLRKDLERIGFGQSLGQLLAKYPAPARVYPIAGRLQAPQRSTDGPHRYASTSQGIIAFGGDGTLSAFDPYGENTDDFSLMQIALTNGDTGRLQTVEAGWQQRKDSYGDWVPHLFTYYPTYGYTSDGDNQGGYNEDV